MRRAIRIMVNSSEEDTHRKVAQEIFSGYLGDKFEGFISSLDDDKKEILFRSAHFLKFYLAGLINLPKEQEHIKDIYGFIGITSLIEFCALNDPKFRKKGKEVAFKNYLKSGLAAEDLTNLIDNIEVMDENMSLSIDRRVDARLELLYEFRSSFVHYITLPPVKREGTMFLATFHQTGLVKSLIRQEKRYEGQDGLFLNIKLSLANYINLVKPCILRNLGYSF